MAVNTTFRTVKLAYECALDPKQIVMQCNLDTSAKGGVSQVCFVTASASVTKAQALSKQVKMSGKTGIKLLYLDEQGLLRSFDYISDFAEDLASDRIAADMPIRVTAHVTDTQTAVSGDEIKVQLVVTLQVYAIESRTDELLEHADGALELRAEVETQNFQGYLQEQVELSDEYETGVMVDEILLFDVRAVTTRSELRDDRWSAQGEAVADIIYRSEGEVYAQSMTIPFVRELDAPVNANVCLSCRVADCKLVLLGTEQNNVMRVEAVLQIEGAVFGTETMDLVQDIFCPTCNLDVHTSEQEYRIECCSEQIRERISATAPVSDEDLTKILALQTLSSQLTSVQVGDGEIVCEGVLCVGAICQAQSGTTVCNRIELPFSITGASALANLGDTATAECIALEVSGRIRRDREIEVGANLCIAICLQRQRAIRGIASVQEGDAIQLRDNGIVVYLPREGMTMWDVAKELAMPMDEIRRQNPDVSEPLSGQERLSVYKELSM